MTHMTARFCISIARLAAGALAAGALLLAGCAQNRGIEGEPIESAGRPQTANLQALMEASDREQLTCTSMDPLSAQHALNDIVFSCPQLQVQATLIEMRDAGWRLVSVDIGSETTHDGVVEMPLTIRIIKLF